MKLIIFDLDQTLVDFISVHDEATQELFKSFFSVDARLTDIDFAGRSLSDNFRELGKLKNVPDATFNEKSSRLFEAYEDAFDRKIPADASRHILLGARELLERLSRTDNIIALYTGDSPGIVASVFRVTELGRYFSFCLYGTEVATRADMVKLAIDKAKKMARRNFKGKDVVIIGDSVRDIECGKLFNALTIAVATGFHSAEKLSEAGPDYLFDDLSDSAKVMRAIG
ncbi:MAG: HAD family hydrolase [Chloroflexi bacterium]|nr:HAD family hydrolase [Chloroflexota bacterium]